MSENGNSVTLTQSDFERFVTKIEFTLDGCWKWLGRTHKSGYGYFRLNGTMVACHRVAYYLRTKENIKGKVIRHKTCDNPICCNPDHLKIGTQKQNVADSKKHNRNQKGSNNNASKLTPTEKAEIKYLKKYNGWTLQELADTFNVSCPTIRKYI